MIAQDVGSAIKGAERGRHFLGIGRRGGCHRRHDIGAREVYRAQAESIGRNMTRWGNAGPTTRTKRCGPEVVETAAPLKRQSKVASSCKAAPVPPKPAKLAAKQKAPPPPEPKPAPAPKPRLVPSTGPLDRQTSRDLDKGRLEVEAKLDLHGMRQRDAHAQLRRFLKTAQARGLKHVLVITGKGADPEFGEASMRKRNAASCGNAVPHWLAEADFAPLVVSYSPAPRRLGGDGALYVRLRRARR